MGRPSFYQFLCSCAFDVTDNIFDRSTNKFVYTRFLVSVVRRKDEVEVGG